LPLLPGARELALGNRTGGLVNNRSHFGAVVDEGSVPPDLLALAFDPQTSGGLLASVDAASADRTLAALLDAGVTAARIGRVGTGGPAVRVSLR
jgi:selenide,water dikinase